jgi:hypothetical protein
MGMAMPLSMIVPMWLLGAVLVAVFLPMAGLGLVSVLVPAVLVPAVIVCHATHLTSLARPPA